MDEIERWVQEELGEVRFGDQRLEKRLQQIVNAAAKQPGSSLPKAMGDWGDVKATYRFLGHEKVKETAVLQAHRETSWQRAAHWVSGQEVILAVQDTTVMDYSHYESIEGLGPTGGEKQKGRGFLAHHVMLFSESQVPLGLVWHKDWVRDEVRRKESAAERRKRPWSDKESYRWVEAMEAVEAAAQKYNVTVVHVGDREADIFELFARAEQIRARLLVRAAQDRRVVDEEVQKLWDAARQGQVAGRQKVILQARPGRSEREAVVEVRYRQVTLRPPSHLATKYAPVNMWAIEVKEVDAPEGEKPLHWLLLSNQAIHGAADALRRVGWYRGRWGIEVYHRVLKSGCRVEERRLKDFERLRRMLAIYRVVAWHLFWMTHIARQRGDEPCTVVLPPEACEALRVYMQNLPKKRKSPRRSAASSTPVPKNQSYLTVGEALRQVAKLGGYLGRKNDGPPGPTVLWRGLMRLWDMTVMYTALRPPPAQTYG